MGKIIYLKRMSYSEEDLKQIARAALETSGLNPEEEKVLRMRQGWRKGEEDDLELEIKSEAIKEILEGMELRYLEKVGYLKKK